MRTRKFCNGCKDLRDIDDFAWANKTRTKRKSRCKKCRSDVDQTNERKTRRREKQHEYRLRKRQELIKFLGEKCKHCGYDKNWRAMCIDHVNGDGHIERAETAPNAIYSRVRKHPDRYQLLCANCNQIKAYENGEWRRKL